MAARCVNGDLVRPDRAEEEPPSTACRQSVVTAAGGVPLGRGSPGQQQSPGGLRGRGVPPPPPSPHQEEVVYPTIQEAAAVKVQVVIKVKVVMLPQEEEPQDVQVQEEEHPRAARRQYSPGQHSTTADRRSRISRRYSTITSRDITA